MDIRHGCGDFGNSTECKYRHRNGGERMQLQTVSGELSPDHVGLCVQGTTEYGYGVTFRGRKADVHKTLISASKVHIKGHVAVADSNVGYIIPCNSALPRKIQQFVQNEIVNESGALSLYLESGTHIGYTKIQQHVHTRRDQELCSAHAKQLSGPSASLEGASPMASVGKVHS